MRQPRNQIHLPSYDRIEPLKTFAQHLQMAASCHKRSFIGFAANGNSELLAQPVAATHALKSCLPEAVVNLPYQ
jgi:hypothetical protein